MCLTVRIALYPGSSPAEEEPGYKATSLFPGSPLAPTKNHGVCFRCVQQIGTGMMVWLKLILPSLIVPSHSLILSSPLSLILPSLFAFSLSIAFSHFAFSLCLLNKEVQLQLVIYRSCHHKSFLLLPSFSPHSPDFPETGTSV